MSVRLQCIQGIVFKAERYSFHQSSHRIGFDRKGTPDSDHYPQGSKAVRGHEAQALTNKQTNEGNLTFDCSKLSLKIKDWEEVYIPKVKSKGISQNSQRYIQNVLI